MNSKIPAPVWFALTQIATQYQIGFRFFEVWEGYGRKPIGMLHPRIPIEWNGAREPSYQPAQVNP